jgi:hypothetical protein
VTDIVKYYILVLLPQKHTLLYWPWAAVFIKKIGVTFFSFKDSTMKGYYYQIATLKMLARVKSALAY